jgi:ribosomal protein S15P/S13E
MELKAYQAEAVEINDQLGAFQDRALTTNTQLALLLSRGALLKYHNEYHNRAKRTGKG